MLLCSNFAGRGYVAGPVGNNRDKTDPQAAMVSLDWFEFGRARGSTLMCGTHTLLPDLRVALPEQCGDLV